MKFLRRFKKKVENQGYVPASKMVKEAIESLPWSFTELAKEFMMKEMVQRVYTLRDMEIPENLIKVEMERMANNMYILSNESKKLYGVA